MELVALKGEASLAVLIIKLRRMIFIDVVGNLQVFTRKQEHRSQVRLLCQTPSRVMCKAEVLESALRIQQFYQGETPLDKKKLTAYTGKN
jgi:hypothetical protein